MGGDEAARLADAAPRLSKPIYIYLDVGQRINPEDGVGSYVHRVQLNNLYDADEDAGRLRRDNADFNDFELAFLFTGVVAQFTLIVVGSHAVNRLIDGLMAIELGKTSNPAALFTGGPQQ